MFTRKLSLLALPILLGALGCAHARPQTKACQPAQAEAADERVDSLNSWSAVNDYFNRYGLCDDGSIAEGSSEAVARLLVDHWNTLPKLLDLIGSNRPLKPFVLRHINATLDTDDLGSIERKASSMCPEGAASLCRGIREAATQALK